MMLLCGFLAIFSSTTVQAAGANVEFEGAYWMPGLSANGKLTSSGIGTDINFKNDLGVKDENFPYGKFTWYLNPTNRLVLSYGQTQYKGDKVVERTIQFGGKTYTVGTRVLSQLDLKYLSLGWNWQFFQAEGGRFKLGTILELKNFWADASLDAPNLVPPVKESTSFTAPLPAVGLSMNIYPHRRFEIYGQVSGMFAGNWGYFLEAEAGIKFFPLEFLSVTGGYKLLEVEAKKDPDSAKVNLSGPFIGATLRF
jgi:hypothetical protein